MAETQNAIDLQKLQESFVRLSANLPQKFLKEIPNDENIIATIQGKFSEWLVCTNKKVHIIKSGFSTGNTGRINNFEIRYESVANAFVEFHISTGYFEIIAIGQPHTKKTYWGNNESNPQMAPNSIGINKGDIEKFKAACAYINARSIKEKGEHEISYSSSEPSVEQENQVVTGSTPNLNQQGNQSVRCPKCGSTNLQIYNEVVGKGVSGTKVCLFGICGLCGAGKTKNVQYWICKNCGYKFKA